MGAPSSNSSYRVTGRLAYGCDDLSADWPHGGTGLGLVGRVYVSPPSQYAVAERGEDGSVERVVFTGGRAACGVEVLSYDTDALAAAMPVSSTNYAEGRLIEWAENTTPGDVTALTNLVFTPTNSDHPGWVLYKAFPLLELNQRLNFSSFRVLSLAVMFLGAADANGRVMAIGPLSRIPGVA